jgi:hypothetical protein
MAKLIASRSAQYVLEAEFVLNFDDTMVPVSGGTAIAGTAEVDFGKTNVAATVFEVIPLPTGATVIGGEVVTDTAFDTATYNLTIGDSGSANRYLTTTDRKAVGRTALVPTGYIGNGENIRIGLTNADVCTTGKMTVRVQYIVKGRSNEVVTA